MVIFAVQNHSLAQVQIISQRTITQVRFKDLIALMKLKLSTLVVLSAVLGYFMGTESPLLMELIMLSIGGVLLTGGSNGFNQIWERNLDAKMNRTMNRPLPQGNISFSVAFIWCSLISILGVSILWLTLNPLCGILGILALYSYVVIYTPLKRVNSVSVTAGAFPGAIPPMLGYVAASGSFGLEPGLLFAMQFMWQFPHFWAIAWLAKEDYDKGGFKMLPFNKGKSKFTAWYICFVTFILIPVSILPWFLGNEAPMIGNLAGILTLGISCVFFLFSFRFAVKRENIWAKRLMFASFFYLPLVQILYVLDKL